jgi:alpha-L-rhamnosidase
VERIFSPTPPQPPTRTPPLFRFYGWDDRLGSGFAGADGSAEAQAAYGFLAMRAWRAWAGVLAATGDPAGEAYWRAYYDGAVNTTRAAGPAWFAPLGLFASADAINAGFVAPSEAAAMVARLFNNSVTICGLSPFNTFFVLQALAAVGELDRGLAAVHECWGVMLRLGATTTWEIAKPAWVDLIHPTDNLPGFQGYTSEAHPWSSGATAWATAHLAGVRATAPGFSRFEVAPHVGGAMRGVAARVPVPGGGALRVAVAAAGGGDGAAPAQLCVAVPPSLAASEGTLRVSEVLAARLTGAATTGAVAFTLDFAPGDVACACGADAPARAGARAPALLAFGNACAGPVGSSGGARSFEAALPLRGGAGCHRVTLAAVGAAAAPAAPAVPPNPFPPPFYPADFIGRDETTAGSFNGTYGAAGFFLVAFDGPNAHVAALPPWVASVAQKIDAALNGPWLSPPPGADPRALADPRNATAPRKIGQWCTQMPTPTFSVDVSAEEAAPGATHQFAFYFVDFDSRGRRQTVQLMDAITLEDISPPVLVGPDFTGGVWLVWQYPRGVRLRVNGVRGDNGVLSAIAFDDVPAS